MVINDGNTGKESVERIEMISLDEVWNALYEPSFFTFGKKKRLLQRFAQLMSEKSTFAHKAHVFFRDKANKIASQGQ